MQADHIGVVAGQSRHQGVGFTLVHQHGAKVVALAHVPLCLDGGQPVSFALFEEHCPEGSATLFLVFTAGVKDGHAVQFEVVFFDQHGFASCGQARWDGQFLVHRHFSGLQNFVVLRLRKHHPLGDLAALLAMFLEKVLPLPRRISR